MSIEKLDLQSPDIVNANFEKLAQLFPNCVTESATGKAIDFDLLKQELNHAVVEGSKERYRLEWPGKREAIVTANLPTTKTLRPVREDSVDFDNTENLYIEGDNLEVLKLLQESYLGKIKMIYIDPPYNTGKDFVYRDNFAKDTNEELIESGQKDEYNQRLVVNPETAGRYHSDWLSMIYPRLKLARNLLKEDGVIFISIDDNEVHNLRKICDEIFGEQNFLSQIVWQRAYAPVNMNRFFSPNHDHLIVYCKNLERAQTFKLPRSEDQLKDYKNPDNDPRGPWKAGNPSVGPAVSKNIYAIQLPSGRSVLPPSGRSWLYSESKYKEMVADNRIYFGKTGDSVWAPKLFLKEVSQGVIPQTLWEYKEVGHSQDATKEVKFLFNDKGVFSYPKPVKYISRILQIGSDREDIILDFFSGSATTAHAMMLLNAKDNKKRKYILVQLPENLDENSEATKNFNLQNLAQLGRERIKRASYKIKEETKADIDYGFRVYRLDDSNMQEVYYRPQDYKQESLALFADNVKPDRTADDLLAQVMLDWGLPLSLKIEQLSIAGKQVFKVAEDSLYACFDKGLDEDFAKEIAKDKPLRVVFRDSGFKDDTAKTNVKQLLKQLSPETEMKVI